MRINIDAVGFDLRPQLRAAVESRLFAALSAFADRIHSVVARLEARVGRQQPDTTGCEIVVTLRPSGKLRVRAGGARMEVAIERAAQAARATLERELAEPSPPDASPLTEDTGAAGAREIWLDGNRISHQTREMLERPENYLQPVRIREYWWRPGVEDATTPPKESEKEREHALARR